MSKAVGHSSKINLKRRNLYMVMELFSFVCTILLFIASSGAVLQPTESRVSDPTLLTAHYANDLNAQTTPLP